ncbi:hypothetical protein C7B77_02605 [Chamaesiphon polymorphus CCALA 037]|uniref:Uncharacterized protein n=1 Tax=Chamaesiphon polymorphus CCALA 037 TaxID=2107692 RepID=A0A2T1GMB5_9CYAN|nr:hypothetical protein C7B77_02605 [Chamaesiphon polymorphus CCALA 037]
MPELLVPADIKIDRNRSRVALYRKSYLGSFKRTGDPEPNLLKVITNNLEIIRPIFRVIRLNLFCLNTQIGGVRWKFARITPHFVGIRLMLSV